MKKVNLIANRSSFASILEAIRHNDLATLRALVGKGGVQRDAEGQTALMHAAFLGNLTACKLLLPLEAGYTDNMGCTALMFAAERGHLEIVKSLLSHEARMQDGNGVTALMLAARGGHLTCVQELIPYESTLTDRSHGTALMSAALCGHSDIVRLLLQKEARAQTVEGVSALMVAAQGGDLTTCKLLLEKEARLQTRNGWTALAFACREKNYLVVQLLKSKEAGLCDKNGTTSLMRAARAGCTQSVECLLKLEAHRQDKRGRTALMYAASTGNVECAKMLAAYEAGHQDKQGVTALMMAGDRNSVEIVTLLLTSESFLKTKQGTTALTYGNIPHYAPILNTLKHHFIITGGTVDVKKIKKRTVLAYRKIYAEMPSLLSFFDKFCSLIMENLDDSSVHVETVLSDCLLELGDLLAIDPDEGSCAICLDSLPSIVYLPCKHLSICELCNDLLHERKCPLCTTPIISFFSLNYDLPSDKPQQPVSPAALPSKSKQLSSTRSSVTAPFHAHPGPTKRPGKDHKIRARTFQELDKETVPGGHFLQRGLIRAIIDDCEEQQQQLLRTHRPSAVSVTPQTNDSPVIIRTGKTAFEQLLDGEMDLNMWPGSSIQGNSSRIEALKERQADSYRLNHRHQ
ncbi:Protein 21.1 [Giardia lamblia P15]|uniref:Protein 21.1 n=1 Tax=Giardia intestinalis (strain P15) TaxID=658858 RepID=E1F119_GIAIA|nr:Protein 21.1 [Giardia lamblia P15]